MRVKQSVCYPLFQPQDMGLDQYFGILSEIGYAAVELWARPDDFEEIVKTAKAQGLAVASMGGHQSLTDGLTKRSNHDRIEAELKESIEIAAARGIPGLICLSGNRQPYQTDLEAIEAVADGLRHMRRSTASTSTWSCSTPRWIIPDMPATTPPGGWRSASAWEALA